MDIDPTKCRPERKRTRKKFEGDHRYFYQFCKRARLYFSELQVLNLLQEQTLDNKGEGMCEAGGATVDKKRGTKVAPRQREGHQREQTEVQRQWKPKWEKAKTANMPTACKWVA